MAQELIIPGYQVDEQVDTVGLKKIYVAVDLTTGRKVFLVHYPPASQKTIQLLSQRANQSKQLHHRCLVSALDSGTVQGNRFYYTFPAKPSVQLTAFLRKMDDNKEKQFLLVHFFLYLLDAMRYIHEAKTTHRNLSTDCLRVNAKEELLVEGFIHTRQRQESPRALQQINYDYLSPEYLMGFAADPKSDLYSLGVIFYELATGKLPYTSNYIKLEEYKKGILPSARKQNPSISERLDYIIMKALSPRKGRYSSAIEWIRDLEQFYAYRPLQLKWKDFTKTCRQWVSSLLPTR